MKKVTEMEEGILILLQKLGCELDVYETTFVWACVCALSTLSYASEAALNADALPRTITRASGLNARSHLLHTTYIHANVQYCQLCLARNKHFSFYLPLNSVRRD